MKYLSTRNKNTTYNLTEVLLLGLAPDGGLFVPEEFTKINPENFKGLSYLETCKKVLSPFFKDSSLEPFLDRICEEAFNFPLEIKKINDTITTAELFHGPTLAFKDFGARFLASCLNKLNQPLTILVATSGDTGGAVASAFYNKNNIKVGILFPKNGVSKEQFNQLTCWGNNIHSFAVDGTFDDCQDLVKSAFNTSLFSNLTSANSINIGRVLAQMTYYAYLSSLGYENFIIPSGNVGNSLGAFWAKKIGFPIKEITLATNANKAILHYKQFNERKSFSTIKTLANAMDVGNPSNLERLDHAKEEFETQKVSDEEILKTIRELFLNYNYLVDPHTATAMNIALKSHKSQMVMSTAHPSKFQTILLEKLPELSLSFPKDLNESISFHEIKPDLLDVAKIIK